MESELKNLTNFSFIVEKVSELLKEAFIKSNSSVNATQTRNYSITASEKALTSFGLYTTAYICIIIGSIGSLIYRKRKLTDPDIVIESFTASSTLKSPIYASMGLFGIFVALKIFPIYYVIGFLTFYCMIVAMSGCSILVEDLFSYIFNLKPRKYKLYLALKTVGDKLKHFEFGSQFTVHTLPSVLVAILLCCWYIFSQKLWIPNNIICFFICVYAMIFVQIETLMHGITLLSGLFLYDIYWVYGTNVMISVATKIDAPLKILFPNDFLTNGLFSRSYALLGLGDIVIPGFYIAFHLRYDNFLNKGNYLFFITSLLSYGFGLILTTIVLYIFKSGQPALLYIVPCLFIGTFITSFLSGNIKNILNYSEEPEEEVEPVTESEDSEEVEEIELKFDEKFKQD